MPDTVSDAIRENLMTFREDVELPGGFPWSHVDTLKKINLYWSGRFETGEKDSRNFKKYFYNVVKPSCETASKFIDLDTKDIIVAADEAGGEWKTWMMGRDLRCWLRRQRFGRRLNEMSHALPKYGSFVIKRPPDGDWRLVAVENLRMEPSATSLVESSFVYEAVPMTRRAIMEMPWEFKGELGARYPEEGRFTIYECYDGNAEGKKWKRRYVANLFNVRDERGVVRAGTEARLNLSVEYEPGLLLHEDEVDELPYREHHWEKIPGRWLGVGFVEYLFDNQIRVNELVNVQAKGLYFTALKVFQTSDETIGRNILTDVENGDIIKTSSAITPVAVEERNLAVFREEKDYWGTNTDRKTFNYDVARGEDLPSGTPLGVARLSAGMIASYYNLKRENLGMFIRDLLVDDVFPTFKGARRGKHLLKFEATDREIDRLRGAYVDAMARKAALRHIERTGVLPSQGEYERERSRVLAGPIRARDLYVDIPDAFYDDLECSVDVVVTGEQVDVGSRIQTLTTALQMIGANPAIVADPMLRSVFFKMLELTGVSPVELSLLEEKVVSSPQTPQAQQGVPPPLAAMLSARGGTPASPREQPAGAIAQVPVSV